MLNRITTAIAGIVPAVRNILFHQRNFLKVDHKPTNGHPAKNHIAAMKAPQCEP